MVCKSVGKVKNFCSSGSVGGELNKFNPLRTSKPALQVVKDDIVHRLRRRAEKYEQKADTATPGRAIDLGKVAKELRDLATSIKLNEWDDADEI